MPPPACSAGPLGRATDHGVPALSASRTFAIHVAEVNTAPELASIADQSVNEGTLLQLTASATDADLPANTLSFSLDAGAPAGAAINATTGVFSWTPSEAQGPGDYSVTVRVTDSGTPALSASRTFAIHVTEVNSAPVLAAIADQSLHDALPIQLTASATDADLPANALTYSLDSGAPAGAAIDATTGVFSWTPSEAQGRADYTVTVRVSDSGAPALDASRTFTFHVRGVDSAPEPEPIADQSVNEGSLLQLTASATDADLPANVLSFSLDSGAPAGAAIDATTGVFSWTPAEAQGPADYSVTVRVTDGGTPALGASRTFAIHVAEVNVAPVLAAIADQSVSEGALLSFTASATDADVPANALTFS